MKHSKRPLLLLLLFVLEVALFIGAAVTCFLAEEGKWTPFVAVSAGCLIAYVLVRLVEYKPEFKNALLLEDEAARMARHFLSRGVTALYNMDSSEEQQRRNDDTREAIGDAEDMVLCANSGASYLDAGVQRHWPFVEKKLRSGVRFRVVLLDPFSEEKKLRNQLNVGDEQWDSKLNLRGIVRLCESYGNLDVRMVGLGMHLSVFATHDCMFVDPYHLGVVGQRIANRTVCLRILRGKYESPNYLFSVFRAHFDDLWQRGEPLRDWLKRVEIHLPTGSIELRGVKLGGVQE